MKSLVITLIAVFVVFAGFGCDAPATESNDAVVDETTEAVQQLEPIPSWFGASRDDAVLLGVLAYTGVDRHFGDAVLTDEAMATSSTARALSFVQQQFDPAALRSTGEILRAGDLDWDDLQRRIRENPNAWSEATEGFEAGTAAGRYGAVDAFVQKLYGGKSWDALDPGTQRAMNYYVAVYHPDWGEHDDDVVSDAAASLLEAAHSNVTSVVEREYEEIDAEQAETVVGSLRRLTGGTTEEVGLLAEYMFHESTVARLAGKTSRTEEEESLLRSSRRRMLDLERDETLFEEHGGVGVARARFGASLSGYGGQLVEGGAEIGILVAAKGADLMQARESMIADMTTHYGVDEEVATRIVTGDFTDADIDTLRARGVSETILSDLKSKKTGALPTLLEAITLPLRAGSDFSPAPWR